jgi:hypothetical protein
MTRGNAATARVRLIVWCKDCGHQVEPYPVEQAQRYGAETAVPDWRESRHRHGRYGNRAAVAPSAGIVLDPIADLWPGAGKSKLMHH